MSPQLCQQKTHAKVAKPFRKHIPPHESVEAWYDFSLTDDGKSWGEKNFPTQVLDWELNV